MSSESPYVIDEIAQDFHSRGIALSVAREDYAAAENYFRDASGVLGSYEHNLDDGRLQLARIERDWGFNNVRQGQDSPEPTVVRNVFDAAKDRLQTSQARTQELLDETENYDCPPDRLQYLRAEHGATVAVMVRTLVAEEVKLEDIGEEIGDTRFKQRKLAKQAYSHLRQGSNAYYQTSHAMQMARMERYHDESLRMLPWLGRAGVGIIKAVVSDRSNLRRAIETTAGTAQALCSRESARESIRRKP